MNFWYCVSLGYPSLDQTHIARVSFQFFGTQGCSAESTYGLLLLSSIAAKQLGISRIIEN